MDTEPELKVEVEEDVLNVLETVNCDMNLDNVEEKPVTEGDARSPIADVQCIASDSVSNISELCDKPLLVYTTRLDDMQIWWNNLNAMYIEEATELIVKESKPKYTGHFENTAYNEQHRRTFSSLKDKIQEINCLPSHTNIETIDLENDPISLCEVSKELSPKETPLRTNVKIKTSKLRTDPVSLSKRSKALLRACKPLSIVLEDCMINKEHKRYDEVPHRTKESIYLPPRFETGDIEFIPKLEDDVRIRDYMSKNKSRYITLKDLCSNDSTIYFISDDINPTEYYRFNKESKQSHYIDTNSTVPLMEIDSCCWYKRKKIIKELTSTVCCRSIFIKTQHTCVPGMCSCCCRKIRNELQAISPSSNQPPVQVPKRAKPSYGSQNNTWLLNLLNRSQDESKWIDKALMYKAKPRQKNGKKYQKANDNYDMNTILQIEHGERPGLKCSFYSMGAPVGSIDTYIEITGGLKFADKTYHFYLDKSNRPRSSSRVCCWYQYNKVLSNLISLVPPSVVKFMKRPHKCAPRKCGCCCKSKATFEEKTPIKLCSLNLPTQLKYTIGYGKKTRQRIPKATVSLNSLSTVNAVISRNLLSATGKVTDQTTVILAPKTLNRNIAPTYSNIDSSSVTPTPPPNSKINSRNIIPMTLTTTNTIDRPVTTSAVTHTVSQNNPSDDILNRVLDGLQGLSIVLHTDNTVTADLDGVPDNLSTENLKILKLLLRYADAYMRNRKFVSNAPMRISNIFSTARKKVGVVQFPTIILDDDDDDSPLGHKASSLSTVDLAISPNTPQINRTIANQQTAPESHLQSLTQFQDQFVKNIEKMNSESTLSEAEQSVSVEQRQDQYEICTKLLYHKRVQYYNSVLSLLNSGNENLSLSLNVPLSRGNTSQDLATCIVEFQCFKNKEENNTVGQKRKALNDAIPGHTGKRNKKDVNTVSIPPGNMAQLPIRSITLPPGIQQITNLQGNFSTDSQAVTLIPVTFVNPQSGQTIGNIPFTLLSASGSLVSAAMSSNTSDTVVKPMQTAQIVQSDPLQNVVAIAPLPKKPQTQTVNNTAATVSSNNIILSRLLNTKSNISEPNVISVESENTVITGIIRNEAVNEDVSILGV